MRISYISDLHFEYNPSVELLNTDDSDVLILAGDIVTEKEKKKLDFWFDDIATKWKNIIYVKGNHEFYGDRYDNMSQHNQLVKINDVNFIVTPLFLPCGVYECLQLRDISEIFSSLHSPKIVRAKWFSKLLDELNYQSELFIHKCLNEINKNEKTIVCTHFPPVRKCNEGSIESYHPYFNGRMEDHQYNFDKLTEKVDYWIYGHTHYNRDDFQIGRTIFTCNQDTHTVKTIDLYVN
jgi:predicted phosphodiesterase